MDLPDGDVNAIPTVAPFTAIVPDAALPTIERDAALSLGRMFFTISFASGRKAARWARSLASRPAEKLAQEQRTRAQCSLAQCKGAVVKTQQHFAAAFRASVEK